ncbi:MAG: HAMP domain-containing histidine kinase [Synergistaceae bacterium]|jgi:signal transduction histidine kinase|nr:HAMP domain-containing histidine kinase [Synergistaceae bacterium]
MRRSLRTQLTLTIALIVLATVALISFLANMLITREFEKYAEELRNARAQDIVANLSRQYNGMTRAWDIGYIHGMGMYALHEGYVIRIYDRNGAVVWDAEDHDMSLCGQIMADIANRMEEKRPNLGGSFSTLEYKITQNGRDVGGVAITSYGPYFFTDGDFRFLDALNMILLAIGAISFGFSLIAGWLLARRISRPIIKTAHIAKQISVGNFGIHFEGRTRTKELDEMVTAVNSMAESLARQENLRKRLTTDVAHELRTPLSAVSSHLELMIESVWEPTARRLQSCYDEISRISELVAGLERLEQMENENLSLNKMPVDLLELARSVAGTFESEGIKKNVSIHVSGEAAIVLGDRGRLHQVLSNLLSNAIKYTPDGGHVRVAVNDTPNGGVIVVEDNGIGIPENELPLIFERFYRTDKSRNRKTGGAGIGLTIAKSIVLAHGGKIEVESASGTGSRFTISLPKNNVRG